MFGTKEKVILKHMGYTTNLTLKPIEDYKFPQIVLDRTKETLGCTDEALEGLQISLLEYFLAVQEYENMEMTNESVDELWHTFLLDTKAYMNFCSEYVGKYIHHNPYMVKKELATRSIEQQHVRFEKVRNKNPKLAKRRETYIHTHRNSTDDDFLNTYLMFWVLTSCSTCEAQVTNITETAQESQDSWDAVDAEINKVASSYTPDTSEPNPTPTENTRTGSSACNSSCSSKSSCSSSNSSNSSSSCSSSSSSSSCGSSCGS